MGGGEVGGKALEGSSFGSFGLGETKRSIVSFIFYRFRLSLSLSLFLLNGSVSRIKDEPVHFVVSKFYTGERLVSIENFWQKIPVNS